MTRIAGLLAGVVLFALSGQVQAQEWITQSQAPTDAQARQSVTLQFRREIDLPRVPASLQVNVTADNRFILYVNGQRLGAGPARGDLGHWRYETLDLAPYLRVGRNVVAAEVWNDGRNRPAAQVSDRTGFRLETVDRALASLLDTGPAWRVRVDPSRSTAPGMSQLLRAVGPTYYVSGAPETHDASKVLSGWNLGAESGDWTTATPAVAADQSAPWTLMADPLPQMRYDRLPPARIVRATGVTAEETLEGPVVIPANTAASLLLDLGRVAAVYPQLTTSNGAGAKIEATYTEALYDSERKRLHDRAAVGDGRALGLTDTFLPAGGQQQIFRSLWWRAGRFIELKIHTADEPLTLNGFDAFETGFPFEQKARFESDDPELNTIWRIGWNTIQFDAHETYMDTAYWEQLQYIGDTRIQAVVSYDVSGDARLADQALRAFDQSRVVDGLPQAAWPSSTTNSIPPFALLWVGMLHDHWMMQADTRVVRDSLPGARAVLDWYAPYVGSTGLVRQTPGWLFIDWRPGLSEQPRRTDAPKPDSCIISLLYLGALKQSAELEHALGDAARAEDDASKAEATRQAIQTQCWDPARGLYADTPDKTAFSQHANVLAVLYDVAPQAEQQAILDRVMTASGIDAPDGITGTTYYFSFYLVRALEHAGLADRYLPVLQTWRDLLRQNFTTWPENPDPSRSDSHAWSAHPTSDLLGIVAGVRPDAPGYARVRVAPHLGELKHLDAATAHPAGLIETRYERDGRRLRADITLPRGVTGVFEWKGQERPLRSGRNRIRLRE
ncbi:alpha-L-rhamnosidase C-terminal domain-containing protein [Brevundimonas sp. Leaf363]|uniref:alpha-L-rhamnosidase-related protein n=1 Tax=Brevundimonas sp. Leaf363 TaxID=1736353 RepID=UPI0012E2ECE6|nr:alpha-L-rhamnosidase C-terminal domain-containing protein [Brevundimonas sp. Leaf363]